jgi:hypothetical protein
VVDDRVDGPGDLRLRVVEVELDATTTHPAVPEFVRVAADVLETVEAGHSSSS